MTGGHCLPYPGEEIKTPPASAPSVPKLPAKLTLTLSGQGCLWYHQQCYKFYHHCLIQTIGNNLSLKSM